MTSFLKSIYRGNIIYAICLIVLGLVFIIWPADSRQLLIRVLGALLVLAGAALIVLYFKAKKRGLPVSIIGGVILVVLGILMLAKPENFVQFVIIVAGAFIGASGVLNFCQTLSLAMNRFRLWWVAMILSIFTIVFAVLVISQPGKVADAIFIITGIFLVLDGISDLWMARMIHADVRAVRNEVSAIVDDLENAIDANSQRMQ